MGDKIKLWCFILLLPFVAAVGHDIWASFYADEKVKEKVETLSIQPEEVVEATRASDFGYLFLTYTPKFYEKAREAVGADNWAKWVDPILRMYTAVVALIPLAIFLIWLVIARVFDIWPFSKGVAGLGKGKKGSTDLHEQRNKGGSFKYKRR